MFFISALFPRPFSASASRILDLDERLVIIRMSARGLFIFLFAEFSDVSYLYLPCVVPRSRKHLSVLLLRTDAHVPPSILLCVYLSIRTAPMRLKLYYASRWKTTENAKSWGRMQRAKLRATRAWINFFFLSSRKNHVPATEKIMQLNKDIAGIISIDAVIKLSWWNARAKWYRIIINWNCKMVIVESINLLIYFSGYFPFLYIFSRHSFIYDSVWRLSLSLFSPPVHYYFPLSCSFSLEFSVIF